MYILWINAQVQLLGHMVCIALINFFFKERELELKQLVQLFLNATFLFLILAAPDLNCSTRGLQSSLWGVKSLVVACRLFSCSMWGLVP